MKKIGPIVILFCMIYSCHPEKLSESFSSEVINIASQFASGKMDSAVIVTDDNGVVSVGDEMVRYVIDPNTIFYGEIDEFEGKDIMVTIDSLHDPYLMPAWHLLVSGDHNQLKIKTAIRSDIRILSISKGVIAAEVPTHEPTSPLYYCSECRDTLYYRIEGNRLVVSDR